MSGDPVHQALAARRAKQRRRARPVEEEQERPPPPLVSQGARGSLPLPRRPIPDGVLREAAWVARGKPRWVRI